MEFTKDNMKEVRRMVQDKLDELRGEGIVIELGNIRYESEHFTSSIKARAFGAELDIERDYRLYAPHSLPSLGDVIQMDDGVYEIKGWKSRSRRYPVLLQNIVTGKRFKFTTDAVRAAKVIRRGES